MKIFLQKLIIILFFFPFFTFAQFGGGTGNVGAPYQISTVAHLKYLSTYVMNGTVTEGKYFKLMNDINMSGVTDFVPIGGWSNATTNDDSKRFMGNFEGTNYKITNLTVTKSAIIETNNNYVGLFGIAGNTATISNVGVSGSFTGYSNVGGLIGYSDCSINNCYATANATGFNFVGGLGGRVHGTVNNSYATGNASGNHRVGGLFGEYLGNLNNCYATGAVSASGTNDVCLGGLVGIHHGGVTSNCYAAPNNITTDSPNSKGVLIGIRDWYWNGGSLSNCYYSTTSGLLG